MGANAFKVCESEMLLLEKTQTGILKPKKKKKWQYLSKMCHKTWVGIFTSKITK